MTINRRDALRQFGFGAVAVGVGMLPARAFAVNSDHHREQAIPPRDHKSPTLRAQPPYKRTEAHFEQRRSKSKHKHHPKLKARSLRAQATLDTPGNRRDLALTMWGEARGYGTLGMRCIGHVIMNRVRADMKMFGGDTIHGVCHSGGKKYHQFSCWNEWDDNFKTMAKLPDMKETNPDWVAFLKADKLAGQILAGIDKDNTAGATYYCASYMIPWWAADMKIVGVMFGHTFYKPNPPHKHSSHHKGAAKNHDHAHAVHHRKQKTLRIKPKRKSLPMRHHAKETHTHLPIKSHKTVSRAHH
jgi:spore germination cell wall hydrolase CwlJ-like protein